MLQGSENEGQGGAQFVADRGHEIALCLIGRLGLVARLDEFDGLRLQHLGLVVQRVGPLGNHSLQRGLDLLSFGFGLGLQHPDAQGILLEHPYGAGHDSNLIAAFGAGDLGAQVAGRKPAHDRGQGHDGLGDESRRAPGDGAGQQDGDGTGNDRRKHAAIIVDQGIGARLASEARHQ
ncbi:hypothetical protein D3C84_850030 [compost metagenome]